MPIRRRGTPKITDLARQLSKIKCDHLMGREVIEKAIIDLAMGRMDASYCQNWFRCPENGWPECTPDIGGWVKNLQKLEYRKIFSAAELKAIATLKANRRLKSR